jgi:glycosyltransferase involved in cell wall biosynthesis
VRACGRPLRVGIITDGLEECEGAHGTQIANGGVGVYIYNLVKHLRLLDSANEYVLIRHGPGNLDIYRNGRSPAVTLPLPTLSRLARGLDVSHRRIVTDLQLDLLHYPNQFGGSFLPPRIKRVVTLHDVTPLLFPRFHPWKRVLGYRVLLRRSLRAAGHVIVDSGSTRADVVRRGLVPESKVTVIPLGVAERFKPGVRTAEFLQRYDLPARFILSVGVLEPRKNHALLVEVLRRLHQAGEQVGLVIVGRDGWRWKDPLAVPSASHLRPWVRIVRNVPDTDLAEFYNRAALFAYPSFYEGFGLPVAEAMACGTPVVTSVASSLPEVAGEAALFADPTDAQDFAAKLLAVLRDSALRVRLAAAGQRQVQNLSWRRSAESTLAVYEKVCGRAAGASAGKEDDD